jgi:hypothetical protein
MSVYSGWHSKTYQSVVPFFKLVFLKNGGRYIIESSTHYFSFGGALGATYNLF